MKSFFLLLFALTTFSTYKAVAQETNIAAAVTTSFHASFKDATDVQWSQSGQHYKADFYLQGQYVRAFYNQNANLLGVTKNLSPVQLPVTLQASLKTAYEDGWISDLFELSDQNGTTYYATVENNESKITLKSVGGQWSAYKKSRKS